MAITMYDSVTVSELPSGAAAYAGYVGGNWPTYATVKAKFPKAHVLSVAINASEDAECLDVETGDALISQAPAWLKRQLARGVWRPVIYTQQSNLGALVAAMSRAGIARSAYRLWSAHYDGQHVCAPHSCGAEATADGTQWTFTALGRNLDQSELDAGFFGAPPTPAPTPKPVEEVEDMGNIAVTEAAKAVAFDAGAYKSITFFADPTVVGKTNQTVRVAVHSHTKGFSQIVTIADVGSDKTGVTFTAADANGVSLVRQGASSSWADIGYYLA